MDTSDYHYTEEQKAKIIQAILDAKQEDKYLGPIPRQDIFFTQEDFLPFEVQNGDEKLKLWTYREPVENPKAILILFHGLSSHLNQASLVAKLLAKNGIETIGFDFRGFGKSQGVRGEVQDFKLLIQDSTIFINKVKELYPNLPFFVSGHSLGGLVTYLISHQMKGFFKGVILFAPALKIFPVQQVAENPNASMFDIMAAVNKNQNVTKQIIEDQFVYQKPAGIQTFTQLFIGMKESQESFSNYEEPFLCIMGLRDKAIDPYAAHDLYNTCKSKEKKLLIIENLWHNVWDEPEIYEIMEQTNNWINAQLSK